MVTYFLFIILFITSLSGNSLNSLEITFYPEYYYSGIMVQVKGEAENELIGESFNFSVPAYIDSAFLFHSVSQIKFIKIRCQMFGHPLDFQMEWWVLVILNHGT